MCNPVWTGLSIIFYMLLTFADAFMRETLNMGYKIQNKLILILRIVHYRYLLYHYVALTSSSGLILASSLTVH